MENIIFIVIAVLGWIIRSIIKKRKAERSKERVISKDDFFLELKKFSNQLILNNPVNTRKKATGTIVKAETSSEGKKSIKLSEGSSVRTKSALKIKNKIKNSNYLKEAFILKEILEKKI